MENPLKTDLQFRMSLINLNYQKKPERKKKAILQSRNIKLSVNFD